MWDFGDLKIPLKTEAYSDALMTQILRSTCDSDDALWLHCLASFIHKHMSEMTDRDSSRHKSENTNTILQ